MSQTSPLERIHQPSPEHFYRQYVERDRPVIVTGVAEKWPACALWRPEYFKQEFAGARVEVEIQSAPEPGTYFRERRFATVDIGHFVDELVHQAQPRYYISQWPLLQNWPKAREQLGSLDEYMRGPWYVPARLLRKQLPIFWLGPAGAFSTLHFDGADNLFVQVYGRKRFILFAPEEAQNLYYPWHELRLPNFSPVDVDAPDLERFPRFAQARRLEGILGPGEMLYIPTGWWHHVMSLDISISLSHWWSSRPRPGSFAHQPVAIYNWLANWIRSEVLGQKSYRRVDQPIPHEPRGPADN